ncbi:MAG: Wzz/FepE/Etk N-terminal domain-containing protein, partial [Betaproteobacteria bacterium]
MNTQSAAALSSELSAGELIATLAGRWRVLLVAPIMAALIAYGMSYALPKTFVSQTVIIPPQQQNSALTALS